MGQQLPLPSVQRHLENWWKSRNVEVESTAESDETIAPVFTGDMPSKA